MFACWKENGIWQEGDLAAFFGTDARVISLVGGGGKSSTMRYLAEYYRNLGRRTAVMTTTRIYRLEILCETAADCEVCWNRGEYAVCGRPAEDGKIMEPESAVLAEILNAADVVLNEADGSKKKPCKVPAGHEPVLLPESDMVIGVMGVDALGRTVEDGCFRVEQVCALLQCDPQHVLTEEDAAKILLSPSGTRKGVETREYRIVLNKCDDESFVRRGKKLADLLEAQGHTKTVLTNML